jgi:hypothetical protein
MGSAAVPTAPGGKTVAAAVMASFRQRRVVEERHELAGVGHAGLARVDQCEAVRDPTHLGFDRVADLRAEAADVTKDTGETRQNIARSVREQFGDGDDADIGRAQPARNDRLEVHDERSSRDEHLAPPMRARRMAAAAGVIRPRLGATR